MFTQRDFSDRRSAVAEQSGVVYGAISLYVGKWALNAGVRIGDRLRISGAFYSHDFRLCTTQHRLRWWYSW